MTLSKFTPCNKLIILAPRWRDKTVLLADWKIGTHNEIEITSKRKNGDRYYPQPMYMSGSKIRSYPTQPHGARKVYIVPLSDLEILERV